MERIDITPEYYHGTLKCNRGNVFDPESWMSKSVLWELHESSLYKWRNYPKQYKPTEFMQWGSLIDCLVTTPELEDETVFISPYDNFKTKAAREWRDELLEQDKIIIKQEKYDLAQKAVKVLTDTHSEAADIIANSDKQVFIGCQMEGMNFKGLIDLVPKDGNCLVDLKTTSAFSMDGFSKTIGNLGYHVQAGLYLEAWNTMYPDDQRDFFKHIWQSSDDPFEVCVTEMSMQDIESGLEYGRHLLQQISSATDDNHWPMLGQGETNIVSIPAWASIQEAEKINKGLSYD